jgi:hypothetical protein
MVKFFKQSTNDKDPSYPIDNSSIRPSQFIVLYKLTLTALVLFHFIQTTKAETCFEIDGHDYTLDCINNEKAIYNQLKSQCNAYQDGADDCARFFTSTLNFCSGVFGGSACTLDYHNLFPPSLCAINVTKNDCKNGYGTLQDILATIGISVGGAIGLCLLLCLLIRCLKRTVSEVNLELSNERPAPVESSPLVCASVNYGAAEDQAESQSEEKPASFHIDP